MCQGLKPDISKEDAVFIKSFLVREAMHLTWDEWKRQPKWVNDADFALLFTRSKATEKGD